MSHQQICIKQKYKYLRAQITEYIYISLCVDGNTEEEKAGRMWEPEGSEQDCEMTLSHSTSLCKHKP